MDDAQQFTCETFHLVMPIEKQPEFCAKRQRKACDGDYCGICPIGAQAAKNARTPEIKKIPDKHNVEIHFKAPVYGTDNFHEKVINRVIQNIKDSKEGEMATNKSCSEKDCGKGSVKDSLCTKHYRAKHGVLPYPKKKDALKARPGQAKSSSGKKRRANGNGHDHECEGCEALQLQLTDLNRAEAIMVAAGLIPVEKFEQARKIARELGA